MRVRRASAIAGGSHEVGRVNVTPLIDVVMCLIVFYLIVGHLVLERRGETRLPESTQGVKVAAETDPMVLTALDDTTALVDGIETPAERLESVLAGRIAREPGLRVQIRGGRDQPYGQVRTLLDACRAAGIARVELAAEQPR